MKKRNLPIAIPFAILAALFFTIAAIFVKLALPTTPFPIILFFRFFICFIFVFFAAMPRGILCVAKTQSLKLTLVRAIFAVTSIGCMFFSLHHIPVAIAVLLSNVDPLLIPIILWLIRDIKIINQLYFGIFIGFFGIALILHPQDNYLQLGALLALAAGISRAVSFVILRQLTKQDSPHTVMFNFFFTGTLLSALLTVSSWHNITEWAWLYIAGLGITSLLFQWFITLALTYAPARIMSSFTYFGVVFAAILDYFLWGDIPSWLTLTGMLLVIIGAVLTVLIGRAKIDKSI